MESRRVEHDLVTEHATIKHESWFVELKGKVSTWMSSFKMKFQEVNTSWLIQKIEETGRLQYTGKKVYVLHSRDNRIIWMEGRMGVREASALRKR